MAKMMRFASLVAIVSMAIVLNSSLNLIKAQETVTTFDRLVESGKSLESASAKLSGKRDKDNLYLFAFEPKGTVCKRYLNEVEKVSDQYQIKALNFVKDSKRPKGWFSGLARAIGPLNGLRSLSRPHQFLSESTEELVAQADVEALSDEDVTCQVARFQTVALNNALFVLQTDIKYLVLEDSALMNRAIRDQLEKEKRTATHNFYEVEGPTPKQRELLKNFFLDHINKAEVSVGDAVQHFDEPSSFILGRLLESCRAFIDFTKSMEQLQPKRDEACAKSNLARKRGELKGLQTIEENMDEFCESLLSSL